jgi:hypothetical protein
MDSSEYPDDSEVRIAFIRISNWSLLHSEYGGDVFFRNVRLVGTYAQSKRPTSSGVYTLRYIMAI